MKEEETEERVTGEWREKGEKQREENDKRGRKGRGWREETMKVEETEEERK